MVPEARGAAVTPQAELDAIYQSLLVDPSDRALNRRMIELAVQLDDYDAAIGAVERLIFYEPQNPDLQLQAARFYMEIESYAAAAGYLSDMLALPDLTPSQRAEATALLTEANRETMPSPWSGFGQVGVRYQSNANHGSVALGLDEPLPFDKPVADWNTFALGTLGLTEALTENIALEATVSGYYADQQKVHRLDLGFAEATAGLKFVTTGGGLSIKPYAIAQGILLGEEPYQSAVGGGVIARITYADGWWLEPWFEYKDRAYYDTDDYPTARNQTGDLYTYAVNLNGVVTDNVAWLSTLAYVENRADAAYQSYNQYAAMLGLEIGFDLFGIEDWTFSPFVSAAFTDFRGVAPPEKYADLDTKRRDQLWIVGANLEMPWRNGIGLGVAVEYAKNHSNLDRDRYDDFSVVVGPQGRF